MWVQRSRVFRIVVAAFGAAVLGGCAAATDDAAETTESALGSLPAPIYSRRLEDGGWIEPGETRPLPLRIWTKGVAFRFRTKTAASRVSFEFSNVPSGVTVSTWTARREPLAQDGGWLTVSTSPLTREGEYAVVFEAKVAQGRLDEAVAAQVTLKLDPLGPPPPPPADPFDPSSCAGPPLKWTEAVNVERAGVYTIFSRKRTWQGSPLVPEEWETQNEASYPIFGPSGNLPYALPATGFVNLWRSLAHTHALEDYAVFVNFETDPLRKFSAENRWPRYMGMGWSGPPQTYFNGSLRYPSWTSITSIPDSTEDTEVITKTCARMRLVGVDTIAEKTYRQTEMVIFISFLAF